jgi:hypothetical protein
MSLLGIEAKPIVINDSVDSLSHFREFSSGAGANIVKSNNEGFFAGATNFTDAPFSVDYEGSIKAGKGTFSGKIEIKDGLGNVVILIDPNASS